MFRRSFLIACILWPTFCAAQAEGPLATEVVISIDTGTNRSVMGLVRRIRQGGKPNEAIDPVASPSTKVFAGLGTLITGVFDRQNFDPEHFDREHQEEGKYFMLFYGPAKKITRVGNKLVLVDTTLEDLIQMRWFLTKPTDGYDKTTLRMQHPIIPSAIASDSSLRIRNQLKKLGDKWVLPHFVVALVDPNNFSPATPK